MTRLFSAFALPAAVAAHLGEHLPGEVGRGLRPTPRERWHVTVGFYGEDDPDERLARLRGRVAGLAAPRLALDGAGRFPGVCWVGVRTPDPGALAALAEAADAADAAGSGYADYRPHVTVARWDRRGPGAPAAADLVAHLRGYAGPEWKPESLVLYRSEQGEGGPRYARMGEVGLLAG